MNKRILSVFTCAVRGSKKHVRGLLVTGIIIYSLSSVFPVSARTVNSEKSPLSFGFNSKTVQEKKDNRNPFQHFNQYGTAASDADPTPTTVPTQTTAPAQSSAPTQTTTPAQTTAPTQTTTPAQTAVPAQAVVPTQTVAPTQATTPVQTAAPAAPSSITAVPTPTTTPTITATPTPTPTATLTPSPVPVEIPQELQEFAKNYPETENFVASYPEKYQLHPEIDLSEEAGQTSVPLFIQWDERWGYEKFGSSFIGCSACGPTSFSMVAVYLTHNPEYSPLYMSNYVDEHGYHVQGVGTSWSFFTKGSEDFGIHCTTISINEEKFKEYLDKDCPIICSVGPGDFTVKGHLIVISGYDKNGLKINDPNSRKNSRKRWDFPSIKSQIRSAWAFSKEP